MTYPSIPTTPDQGQSDVALCGEVNSGYYIEPNADGSINTVLVQGTLSLSPTVEISAGTAVIGHVITDTGSLVQLEAGTALVGGVNVAEINGVATSVGNGASGTGVQRVTIANDSTGLVKLAAGTNVFGHAIIDTGSVVQLEAGTAVIGHVINDASTEVIGHVINDASTAVIGHVIADASTAVIGTVQQAKTATEVALGTQGDAQILKGAAGYLSGVMVSAIDNPAAAITFYDHATLAQGKVIGFIPDTATAGSYWPFNMPAALGIVAGKVNHSPALTVAFS